MNVLWMLSSKYRELWGEGMVYGTKGKADRQKSKTENHGAQLTNGINSRLRRVLSSPNALLHTSLSTSHLDFFLFVLLVWYFASATFMGSKNKSKNTVDGNGSPVKPVNDVEGYSEGKPRRRKHLEGTYYSRYVHS